MSQTDDYLAKFLGEAELAESGLKFQVDWATQLRKLRSFQSDESGMWIMKAVQAAVAARAPEVVIRFTNEVIEVAFEPRLDLNSNLSCWAEHLRTAVELAVSQEPPGLRLAHQGRVLFASGVSQPLKPGGMTCLQCFRPSRTSLRWEAMANYAAQAQVGLARRCCLCPIPVHLDGLVLNQGRPERCKMVEATRPDLTHFWLAEQVEFAEPGQPAFILSCPALRPAEVTCLEGAELPATRSHMQRASLFRHLRVPAAQVQRGECESALREQFDSAPWWMFEVNESVPSAKKGFNYVGLTGVAALVKEKVASWEKPFPTAACSRWLGLSARGDCGGGLLIVNDGVLLNRVKMQAVHPGTTAFLATSGLATDLSQLNPVQDEHFQALLKWAQESEVQLAEDCRLRRQGRFARSLSSYWH